MKITIYGTRGSYASPSDKERHFYTDKYGGYTTSLLLKSNAGEIILPDGGTGMIKAGDDLIEEGTYKEGGANHKVLLTHFHPDHTEGIPYFKPMYDPRNTFHIFGNADPRIVEELLNTKQKQEYFPVAYQPPSTGEEVPYMRAKKIHHSLHGNIADTLDVSYAATNHRGGCVAYKFTENGKSFIFGGDHEFGDQNIDEKLKSFYKGALIIVQDSQYTPEERNPTAYGVKGVPKVGWGHSDFKQVVDFMLQIQPEILVLTHHDPERDDTSMDKMYARIQEYAKAVGLESKIVMAQPGMRFEL